MYVHDQFVMYLWTFCNCIYHYLCMYTSLTYVHVCTLCFCHPHPKSMLLCSSNKQLKLQMKVL